MSIQRLTGCSLAQATIGALVAPPHVATFALGSPARHGAATYSRLLISKIVLAACPHGLGTPLTSTMRKPGWSTISSKLRYCSMAFSRKFLTSCFRDVHSSRARIDDIDGKGPSVR